MLRIRNRKLGIAAIFVLLATNILISEQAIAQESDSEHVYYGYVPPSTNIPAVDEVIGGAKINYTVPSSTAILDVVGLIDGTNIEIWNIYVNQRLYSAMLNKLEKKFFFIPVGTFFKIIASKRIAALLSGGSILYDPDGFWLSTTRLRGGTSTFYPAVTGGFRGREFIFNAAPATHPWGYSADHIGYNFYIVGLEETDWALVDAVQISSKSGHLSQYGTATMLLQSRFFHGGTHGGFGNDVVFHLTTTSDVEVSCCAIGDFVAVPAITGGYIGRLFYAPLAVTFDDPGRTAAFIAIPLKEGQLKVYDRSLNQIASHSFTTSDVDERNYWYYELGTGRYTLFAESTGDIAFMVGQTEGTADISHMGDDITFVGSRPAQEIRFYAPTMAVVFAPEALTATIDGGAPVQMAKDDFRLLESGVHAISADKHVIVEVLAGGSGWNGWGSCLIEPADADVSFEVPQGFLSKPADYTMYIAVAAVAAMVVVLAVFMMRRKRASAFKAKS
jgi:hypothetical protein